MTNYFFINDKGNQVGPINKEELINKGIKKDTLIWYEGITDWTAAEKLEELNFLFGKIPPPLQKISKDKKPSNSLSNKKKYIAVGILTLLIAISGIYFYQKREIEMQFQNAFDLYKTTDSLDYKAFEQLTKKKHGKAAFFLGRYYYLINDTTKALESYQKAKDYGETLYGDWGIAGMGTEENFKDFVNKNKDLIIKEAENGNWFMQVKLGSWRLNGDEWRLNGDIDSTKAFEYIKLAAENGSLLAEAQLGFSYYNGTGVKVNKKEGINHWKRAAESGNMPAQAAIAHLYLNGGDGIKKNSIEAIKWYNRLASKKDTTAALNLYLIYSGLLVDDVPKDENEANKWLNLAAENGSLTAEAGKRIIKREKENLRSNSSKTNGSNQTNSGANCEWCGRRFFDDGYSIYMDEIIPGKMKDPYEGQIAFELFGGKGRISNVGYYCTRRCTVDAYNAGARDKSSF
jgi:TPR repeat protein